MGYKIKTYETSTGKRPFDKWFNDLDDKKAQAVIDLRLERVKMGNLGHCDPVGNMVFELKFDIGPGYRVYFGKIGTNIILLLCAGSKKAQQRDIEKAKKYFQEFKNSGARL
ncbi:MAG: type II toxin-antitoxin system RelE/ParE family toxin [bacterium]